MSANLVKNEAFSAIRFHFVELAQKDFLDVLPL
jgi:hypothetical protein